MHGASSGGTRLFSFRQGDRSEYLALYALTRIAYVTPVPRQEDFGIVDFKCVLAKKEGRKVRPYGTFNVQVKSRGAKLNLSNDEIRWISTNMESPLFICIVDKKGPSFKLYSCLNLWSALFLRMDPNEIILHLNKVGPNGDPYIHHQGITGDKDRDNEGYFDVFLGPPIIDSKLLEFDTKTDLAFEILDRWIKLDRINVALMRLGRSGTYEFQDWTTNQVPQHIKNQKTFIREINQHGLLDKIITPLESLRGSYYRIGPQIRALQIDSLISSFKLDIANSPGDPVKRFLE